MFCDGEECYSVDEVPDGEWFCQRCEALKMKKPVHTLCCPMEGGAVRQSMIPGEFIHVVCAMWNKTIDFDTEPYEVTKGQLDLDKCYICTQKNGLCVPCEDSSCSKYFHVTCAINSGIITAASSAPSSYSLFCAKHLMKTDDEPSRSTLPRRRKLLRNDMRENTIDEEYEEDDDEEDGEDNNTDEEDGDASADRVRSSLLKQRKDKQQDMSKLPIKRRATAQHAKNSGPIKLFQSDQSDSDDDMGTSSRKVSQKSRTSITSESSGLTPTEAKHKISKIEKGKTNKPFGSTPSLALDRHKPFSNGATATAPPKQKLPNKTHLGIPTNSVTAISARPLGPQSSLLSTSSGANNGSGSILGGSNSGAGLIRSPTTMMKEFEEPQNDYRAPAQRRNTLPIAPQTPTNDAIPYPQTPTAAPFDIGNHVNNLNRRNQPQTPLRKSMDIQNDSMCSQTLIALKAQFNEIFDQACLAGGKSTAGDQQAQLKLQTTNLEANRLREELRRAQEQLRRSLEFKKNVAEVFEALNVRIPGVATVTPDTVDAYVTEIKGMLVREGPTRANESARLADTVDKIMNEHSY
ncbi:nuA3 HAT complex component nto1 [Apophysomyces sp. BC1034]|nr:nuA3 HAT complex component nto1 [Apophysomyces sp. BC1034]